MSFANLPTPRVIWRKTCQVPVAALLHCVTSGKLLHLSEHPQCLHSVLCYSQGPTDLKGLKATECLAESLPQSSCQVVVSICLTTSRDLRLMASIAVCAALGCLGLALTVSVSLLG